MEDERGFFRTSDPGTYSFKRLKQFNEEGRLYAPYSGEIVVDDENRRVFASNGGSIGIKYYLTRVRKNRYAVERGVDNLWEDIPGLGTTPGEDMGYPTQKTEALLRRALSASTRAWRYGVGLLCRFGHDGRGRAQDGAPLDRLRHQLRRRPDHRAAACSAVVQEIGPGFTMHAAGSYDPIQSEARADGRQHDVDAAANGAADVSIDRDPDRPGLVEMEINDYRPDPASLEEVRASERVELGGDWRCWVDAVDIDTAYDGSVFRSVHADLPHRRRDLVAGGYSLAGHPRRTGNRGRAHHGYLRRRDTWSRGKCLMRARQPTRVGAAYR